MDIWTKVLFQDAVEDLRLAIRLWVVRGTQLDFGATQLKQLMPEVADKNGVSIRHQALQKSMKLADNVNEKKSDLVSWLMRWECPKMCPFGEPVDYDENGAVPLRQWQACNEVEGQIFPDLRWYRKRL